VHAALTSARVHDPATPAIGESYSIGALVHALRNPGDAASPEKRLSYAARCGSWAARRGANECRIPAGTGGAKAAAPQALSSSAAAAARVVIEAE